jgi:Tetracyclin repressor-like, C-terminal domain
MSARTILCSLFSDRRSRQSPQPAPIFWLAWEGAILQAKRQRSTQPIEDFRDVLFSLILVSPSPQGATSRKPRTNASLQRSAKRSQVKTAAFQER